MLEKISESETPEEKQRRKDELAAIKYDEQRGKLEGGVEVTHYNIHDYLAQRRGERPSEPEAPSSET